jgi:hypothetical protein
VCTQQGPPKPFCWFRFFVIFFVFLLFFLGVSRCTNGSHCEPVRWSVTGLCNFRDPNECSSSVLGGCGILRSAYFAVGRGDYWWLYTPESGVRAPKNAQNRASEPTYHQKITILGLATFTKARALSILGVYTAGTPKTFLLVSFFCDFFVFLLFFRCLQVHKWLALRACALVCYWAL